MFEASSTLVRPILGVKGWKTIAFSREKMFSSTPVVLTTITSANTPRQYVASRVQSVTTSSFQIALENMHDLTGHEPEVVDWLAFSTGDGKIGGKQLFEARLMGSVNQKQLTQNFAYSFSAAPAFFAAPQSYKQAAPVMLKLAARTTKAAAVLHLCGLLCDANQASCGNHHAENTAYLAIQGQGIMKFYSQAVCDDKYKNGDEEGVDCGGSCKKCVKGW